MHDSLYEQRRKLGKCYKCGDKFVQSHQCNKKNLNIMNDVDEENDEFLEVEKEDNNEMIASEDQIDEYELSLNALAESYAHNTIRIKENCQNKNLVTRACDS